MITSLLKRPSISNLSTVVVDPDSRVLPPEQTLQWDPWGWDSSWSSEPGDTSAGSVDQQADPCWDAFVASVDQHICQQDAAWTKRLQQATGGQVHQQKLWLAISSLSTLVVYYSIGRVRPCNLPLSSGG